MVTVLWLRDSQYIHVYVELFLHHTFADLLHTDLLNQCMLIVGTCKDSEKSLG